MTPQERHIYLRGLCVGAVAGSLGMLSLIVAASYWLAGRIY